MNYPTYLFFLILILLCIYTMSYLKMVSNTFVYTSVVLLCVFSLLLFINGDQWQVNLMTIVKNPPKYLLLIPFLLFIYVIFIYASKEQPFFFNSFIYSVMVLVFFCFSFIYLVRNEPNKEAYIASILGLLFVMSVYAVYYYIDTNDENIDKNDYFSVSNISFFISILIVITTLAIIMYQYSKYVKNRGSIPEPLRFLIGFIFYIPCLLLDLVVYISNEMRMTPRPIYILLFIEFILILIYFLYPLFREYWNKDKTILLHKYSYLDKPRTLITADKLQIKDTNSTAVPSKYIFLKNYAISMWIFINARPATYTAYKEETNIFNYGNGLPRITYINEIDKVVVHVTNNININDEDDNNRISIDIDKQKWNQFVLNYTSAGVDLFVNGHLVKSVKFTDNLPIYSLRDTITIGAKSGLYGAIANVEYHKETLTKTQIITTYNLLMNRNPPINII